MILGIQILGILFALFMLYYTFLNFKRKEFKAAEFSLWVIVWALFLIVTLFPEVLDPVVLSLSLQRTMDFFIILGFMFLIGLGFYSYSIAKKSEKKIEMIVRKVAFDEVGKSDRKRR